MTTILPTDRTARVTYFREKWESLQKGLADGTVKRLAINPITHKSYEISSAAQTAHQTGTPPAVDGNEIDVSLLKAAAQRRLGRPFQKE